MKIIEECGVNVWYTAPTALRMLMQEEDAIFVQHDFSNLNRVYSVGEPLNPEIYSWGKRIFNAEIYDTWFQSETGSIMIANTPNSLVKPGSMGIPRQGIEVEICDENMNPQPVGKQGQLCLKKGWHSMFRTFFRNPEKYLEKFRGELYITGDLAKKDEEGYIWYVSRADDVINTAGHLVGPFEVESALLEIEEVADVAIIGADDPLLYQKLVAFIKLHDGVQWTKELELKCRIHVSNKVSSVATPSEFQTIERIPKNQSGKILRRVLKAIYEGRDPGDLSTMEE
jgi:acetyl-CoA synthetase